MPGDPKMAFCKACKTGLCARKKDLSDHEKSRKHRKHFARNAGQMNELFAAAFERQFQVSHD